LPDIKEDIIYNNMSVNGGSKISKLDLVFSVDAGSYRSYIGTGTAWNDLSGNKYNGTLTNGPTFSANNGGYFSFDGTNDYVDTTYPATDISFPTFEAWVYRTRNDGAYKSIVQINNNSDDALYAYPGNNLGFWPCSSSSLTVPLNEWAYVAASFDGTNITYCVNGTMEVVSNSSCSHITDFDYIRLAAINGTDSEIWGGRIASARVYKRSLSQTEMTQNYNSQKRRFI
jgi:hypothetical protein